MLLGRDGSVKLADLGVARQLPSTLALCNTTIGTPCYMAPETLDGNDYGNQADIWSLGVTTIDMAQGKPPWGHIKGAFAVCALTMPRQATCTCMRPFAETPCAYSRCCVLICTRDSSCTLQVIRCIQSNPPPMLDPVTPATDAFHDFLSATLIKTPAARSSAAELLKHRWIIGAQSAPLAELVANVVALDEAELTQAGGGGGGVADPEDEGATVEIDGDTIAVPGGGGAGGGTDDEGATQLLEEDASGETMVIH